MEIISMKNVVKRFKDKTVINNLSFNVNRREGIIMDFSIRRVSALIKREAKDVSKNGNVIIMFAMAVALSLLYKSILGDNLNDINVRVYIFNMLVGMNIAFSTTVVIAMLIAEEKEKNTLRTLMLSGVTSLEFIFGKALITFMVNNITNACIFFILGMDIKHFLTYIRQKSPILYRWVMNAVWCESYL